MSLGLAERDNTPTGSRSWCAWVGWVLDANCGLLLCALHGTPGFGSILLLHVTDTSMTSNALYTLDASTRWLHIVCIGSLLSSRALAGQQPHSQCPYLHQLAPPEPRLTSYTLSIPDLAGTFSGTPEDAYYVSNLQRRVAVPKGVTACVSGYTGVIMGQQVAVITTGESWHRCCIAASRDGITEHLSGSPAKAIAAVHRAPHTTSRPANKTLTDTKPCAMRLHCDIACLLQASAPLLQRCACMTSCRAVGSTSGISSSAAPLAGRLSWEG